MKNYLNDLMSQERLGGIATLAIISKKYKNINYKNIIEKFTNKLTKNIKFKNKI